MNHFHLSTRSTGFSLITNACSDESLCHEEVLEVGKQRALLLQTIVIKVIERLELDDIQTKIEQVCAPAPAEGKPEGKPESKPAAKPAETGAEKPPCPPKPSANGTAKN